MLNYNNADRKRKVTLQHLDSVWRETLRGGGGGGGGGEVFVLERKKIPPALCLFFFFFLALPVFLFPDLGLPGGLTGRWKRLYRNNKPWEETMGETERWQRRRRRRRGDLSERSRASTRVHQAHGSAPVLISISLTSQTYIAPPGKVSGIWPPLPETSKNSFPTDARSLITAWLDLIQCADVSTLRGLVLKDKLNLIKATK